MATRTIHICDRCKSEFDAASYNGFIKIETVITVADYLQLSRTGIEWDLCPDCHEKLRDFLYMESDSK